MISYIDVYVGEWGNEAGNRLSIRKFDDKTCFVSFFHSQDNLPIRRPWCADKLSVEMVAKYRPEYGPELIVALSDEEAGFTLHLNFEAAYMLDDAGRDALVPALSRYEADEFLDQYYRYFGPLTHYTRRTGASPGVRSTRSRACRAIRYLGSQHSGH